MWTAAEDNEISLDSGPVPRQASRERRWDLAFIGILGYLIVEYMRLPAQYPIFKLIDIGKIVLSIALLGWVLSARPRYSERSPVRRLDLGLAFLACVALLSACFAFDSSTAWASIIDLIQWLFIYFLIGRVVNTPWRVRVFTFLLLLLNFKMAQFAMRSYSSAMAYGRSAEFMASQGAGAGSTGFFANAGDFGVAMAVVWPIAAMLIQGERKLIWRVVNYVFVFTYIGAVLTSSSRGALVAMVLTAVFGYARSPKKILGAFFLALTLFASFFLMPEASKKRLESALHPESDKTASTRLYMWKTGLQMFYENPVLGVGPGNYRSVFAANYAQADAPLQVYVPHSIYIQSLSELGSLGTLAYILIVFFLWRLNVRTRKFLRARDPDEAPRRIEYRLSLGVDLAMAGFLISGAFLTVLYYPHLWVLLGLGVAAYSSATRVVERETLGKSFMPPADPAWDLPAGGNAC